MLMAVKTTKRKSWLNFSAEISAGGDAMTGNESMATDSSLARSESSISTTSEAPTLRNFRDARRFPRASPMCVQLSHGIYHNVGLRERHVVFTARGDHEL